MIAILGKGFISCLISSNNWNPQLLSFQKMYTLLGVLWNVWPWSSDYARLSFGVYWYLKKSSIKMFPFNFQLSDDFCEVFGRKSHIGFSVAMSNGRFLCLLKHLSELSITKSDLVWFSWPFSILLKSSHHEAGLSRKRFYGSDVW